MPREHGPRPATRGYLQRTLRPASLRGLPVLLPARSREGQARPFVAWWEGDPQSAARVFLATSHDGGSTWSAPVQVRPPTTAADQQNRPALALALNGGLDVVFYDRSAGGQDVYWVSTKDGRTFEPAVKVTDHGSDPTIGAKMFNGVTLGEFLAVTSTNNVINVAWTDTRRGNSSTGKQDIYFGQVRR